MTIVGLVTLMPVVLVTSFLSGIFGMAGGLILLWFLFLVAPASTAITVHGIIQMVSNGSRAWFSRQFLDVKILAIVCLGLALAASILSSIQYSPNAAIASIVLGLLPLVLWVPKSWLILDASRPVHAFLCGFISGGLSVMVGSAGPLIDVFFIRTQLDRRVVIATKAAIQVVAHLSKVIFYLSALQTFDAIGWAVVLLCVPTTVFGAWLGKFVLDRISDVQFRSWTRLIVTAIGLVFLLQGTLAVIGQ